MSRLPCCDISEQWNLYKDDPGFTEKMQEVMTNQGVGKAAAERILHQDFMEQYVLP